MIIVTVKLVSALGRDRDRVLGELKIVNDGTGDTKTGNYRVELFSGRRKVKTAEVKGFKRRAKSWIKLLRLAVDEVT